MKTHKSILLVAFLTVVVCTAGCFLLAPKAPQENPEQQLLREITTAFESRAYESSITLCRQFLDRYPESERKDGVFIKLGESYEGLLRREYHARIEEGMEEASARAAFFAKYNHYDCWEDKEGVLVYNKEVYRRLLAENPHSPYADEAAYNLISWEEEADADPSRLRNEIDSLNKLLNTYPTSTLRPKIFFQLGYRFHLLYEIYSFSPDHAQRDREKAQENLQQAEYLYRLCLNTPRGSEYSKKALRNLELIRQGTAVFITPQ